MNVRPKRCGFTLVEIMVVVFVVGVLAMLAREAMGRINLHARAAAYVNDCRVFGAAFTQYAQEKGGYPPDGGPHFLPAGMAEYLNRTQWLRPTPLGGNYDWDNIDSWTAYPEKLKAAIAVAGCTLTLAELRQIDVWFDDGNVATGNLRVTNAGATVIYVVER